MTASQKATLYRLTLLTVLVVAVYGTTLGNRFVWDDLSVIVKNPLLEKVGNLPRLFLYEDRTADGPTGYYRPVTYISFMLDRSLWGLNPTGFNLTNLILHVAVVLLLYGVVSALFRNERLALVAALLFALHPVAAESVNFHAGGRNTLLCAAFALLALLLYIKERRLAALLCFIVAIFSKEFALLLPLVLIAYDRYVGREKERRLAYVPYFLAIICYLILRSFAVEHGNLLTTIRLSGNLLLIPRIVVEYLKNMLFPLDLKVIYDLSPDVSAPSFVVCSLLLLAVTGGVVACRKKVEFAASAGWFFLFLLPVLGIVPLGTTLIADRYAYFSLMGFSLALAYVICRGNSRVVVAVTAVLCVGYAAIDLQRNAIWKDMPSLYTQMTIDAPEWSIGFTNLGMYYYEKGDLAKAEKYLEESCSKKGIVIRDAYQYLAAVYWEGNRFDKALSVLNKLMDLEPGNPQSYIMASRIYDSMGDKAMARKYYDKVAALFPNIDLMLEGRVAALCREGEKLMAEGRSGEAERKFKEALMMKPDSVPALIDMGNLVAEKGNLTGAAEYFGKAAALEPLNPQAHYNLSLAYDMMGRPAEAAREMKRYQELEASAGQGKGPAGR